MVDNVVHAHAIAFNAEVIAAKCEEFAEPLVELRDARAETV